MEKYLKLTSNSKIKYGKTLFQMEVSVDCKWGKSGTKSGWIENIESIKDSFYEKLGWISEDSEIMGGTIRGGEIMGGEIWGGEIWGGEIWGGEIWGGTIRGGEIWGGTIRGGEIRGGTIRGGTIRGGTIWGGEIRGGEIMGGTIWGGEIRGGEIWGGVYFKTILQIQGSIHYVNICDINKIQIGCISKTFDEWKKEFKQIGKENNYTENQILEYYIYIKMCIEFIKNNPEAIK